MAFLPDDFEVPTLLETEGFLIRPISIHDLVKDYDAVMTNREHLWALFGEVLGWPQEDLSPWSRTSWTSAGTKRSSRCAPPLTTL